MEGKVTPLQDFEKEVAKWKKKQYFWTEKAKSDLRNLYDYYCEEVSE